MNDLPSDIVAQLLVDAGLGTGPGGTEDWATRSRAEADTPDDHITVYDTTPQSDGSEMPTGETMQHWGIQIRVRSADGAEGWLKAWTIFNHISKNVNGQNVTVEGTTYRVDCFADIAGPLDITKERPASERRLFTVNAIVSITE